MSEHRITIVREADKFIARFAFTHETKDLVKNAGFRFDPARKLWWTVSPEIAGKLDPQIAAAAAQKINANIAQSKATDAPAGFMVPTPTGLAYRPFQLAGIAFAMTRVNTLIGDEMGLGKTLQAIGVANADTSIRKILCIVKASIKINWEREITKWLTRSMTVAVANGTFPEADIVVVNYDILKKHHDQIHAIEWDLLVVDECHMIKNPKAQRTIEVLGRQDYKKPVNNLPAIKAARRIFMTGTPIVNKPIELWPLVQALDPQGLGRSFWQFATRYCNAHKTTVRVKGGFIKEVWEMDGSSNLDELQMKMRSSFMIRRLKKDVLTELPPKTRQIILMPTTDRRILELLDEELKVYASLNDANVKTRTTAFERISALRHDIAVAKIPMMVEFITEALEESRKIVVFAHHHDVVDAMMEAFAEYGAVKLTGQTSEKARQDAIDTFQTNPNCRVFVGSIQAAGAGITLTASEHVIFCESDWVPGNMCQAEDRCHRIGTTGSVLVQHLVLNDSLDARMAQVCVDKQAVIDQALDTGSVEVDVPVIVPNVPEAPKAAADDLTQEQIAAIHQCIQMLAGMCDGAYSLDGMGFNKIDAPWGHSFAAAPRLSQKQAKVAKRWCIKYQRQLPANLLTIIKG